MLYIRNSPGWPKYKCLGISLHSRPGVTNTFRRMGNSMGSHFPSTAGSHRDNRLRPSPEEPPRHNKCEMCFLAGMWRESAIGDCLQFTSKCSQRGIYRTALKAWWSTERVRAWSLASAGCLTPGFTGSHIWIQLCTNWLKSRLNTLALHGPSRRPCFLWPCYYGLTRLSSNQPLKTFASPV